MPYKKLKNSAFQSQEIMQGLYKNKCLGYNEKRPGGQRSDDPLLLAIVNSLGFEFKGKLGIWNKCYIGKEVPSYIMTKGIRLFLSELAS